jgi:hypothetical protein
VAGRATDTDRSFTENPNMLALTRTIRRLAAAVLPTRTIAVVTLAAAVAACGGGDKAAGPGDAGVRGTYALSQVDGHALPTTIFDDLVDGDDGQPMNLKIAILSGTLTLRDDGRFAGTLSIRVTANGQSQTTPVPTSGTYVVSGSTIEFESDDPEDPQFAGTVHGGRLEISLDLIGSDQPSTYVFKK